ncbi:hypothetical protein IID21_04380 [Patescibacteria group bacterium]|nr:hypothetical protein [Patescibacteria group bacterium]
MEVLLLFVAVVITGSIVTVWAVITFGVRPDISRAVKYTGWVILTTVFLLGLRPLISVFSSPEMSIEEGQRVLIPYLVIPAILFTGTVVWLGLSQAYELAFQGKPAEAAQADEEKQAQEEEPEKE